MAAIPRSLSPSDDRGSSPQPKNVSDEMPAAESLDQIQARRMRRIESARTGEDPLGSSIVLFGQFSELVRASKDYDIEAGREAGERTYSLALGALKTQCVKGMTNSASDVLSKSGKFYLEHSFGAETQLEHLSLKIYRIYLNIFWVKLIQSPVNKPSEEIEQQNKKVIKKIEKKIKNLKKRAENSGDFSRFALFHEMKTIGALSDILFACGPKIGDLQKRVSKIKSSITEWKDRHSGAINIAANTLTAGAAIGGVFFPPLLIGAGTIQAVKQILKFATLKSVGLDIELESAEIGKEFAEKVLNSTKTFFKKINLNNNTKRFIDSWGLGCAAMILEDFNDFKSVIFDNVGEFSKSSEEHALGAIDTLADIIEVGFNQGKREVSSKALFGAGYPGLLQFAFDQRANVRELAAHYIKDFHRRKIFSSLELDLCLHASMFVERTSPDIGYSLDNAHYLFNQLKLSLEKSSELYNMQLTGGHLNERLRSDLFCSAVLANNTEKMKDMLDGGTKPDELDQHSKTPLAYAAQEGHVDAMRLLLDHSADPSLEDLEGNTPLHFAAENSNEECAKLLLENRADHTKTNEKRETPLFVAIRANSEPITRILLEKTRNPSNEKIDGMNLLHYAAKHRSRNCLSLIVKQEGLQELLESEDETGETALQKACINGDLQCVALLLELGADTNHIQSSLALSPLALAAQSGNQECCLCLIDKEAEINHVDVNGNTPLHYATWFNNFECVRALVRKGAYVDIKNHNSRAPLVIAAKNARAEYIPVLLGGDCIQARESYIYESFVDVFRTLKIDCLEAFLERGIYIPELSELTIGGIEHRNISLLEASVRLGSESLVKLLLKYNVEYDQNPGVYKMLFKKSPLDIARELGHQSIAAVISEYLQERQYSF